MAGMTAEIEQGWLVGAQRCPSPNCDERPDPGDISLLVIHNISLPPGEFGNDCVRQLFCNTLDCDAHSYFDQLRDLRVSSHLLIDREGSVTQFVNFDQRAWHAGVSEYQGRSRCNDFSIGIELEGTDHDAYTGAQYDSLVRVTHELMAHYPAMSADRIAGHEHIAPGRKTDPGPSFDWDHYLGQLPRRST